MCPGLCMALRALRCGPQLCIPDSGFSKLGKTLGLCCHVLYSSECCPPSRSALPPLVAASGGAIVRLNWPALTPALTEIRVLVLAECSSASGHSITLNWNSRLFSSRRQAHFLLAKRTAVLLMPNVRAKLAPTVWRQAQTGANVPRTARLGLVTRRWGSA